MLRNTPETDPLYSVLEAARTKLSTVVLSINERKKEAESLAKVLEIRDHLEDVDEVPKLFPIQKKIKRSIFRT